MSAEPCDDSPVPLEAGPGEISVDPGPAFTVDTVGLVVVDPDAEETTTDPGTILGGAPQVTRAVGTGRWDASRRELVVPAAPRERVLVVPESVTPAWQARLVAEDGSELPEPRPVTVDGWKQGWVLPPTDTATTLVLTVPLDGPYRAALLTGPVALLLVLLLFLARGRRDHAGERSTVWRTNGPVAVVATAAFGFAVAGPAGVGVFAGLTAAALVASRYLGAGRARTLLVAGAAVGIVAGATLLARAPWPDPLGYAGDEWGPQVATVAGLVCAGLAATWPSAGRPRGARRGASQRWDGTSTNA